MGFWTKVEKWSEKHVEGFFKQKFSGSIQPAEIAKMIAREMRDRKTVSVSKIYIPNEYTIFVGDKDWDNISSIAGSLSRELQDFVRRKAEQRKYVLVGPPLVKFEKKEGFQLGTMEVKGRFTEGLHGRESTPEAPDVNNTIAVDKELVLATLGETSPKQEISQNTLVGRNNKFIAVLTVKTIEGYSMEYPIGFKSVTIGRRRSCEIPLLDENVSRIHAEILYSDGVHQIEDRGSTNGIFVNGQRVLRKKLMDGDLIKMGNSILEYKVI